MVDEMCKELKWYHKLLIHIGAIFSFLTLPIQIPVCIGMYIWYYVKEGKEEADAFKVGAVASVRFTFHHDVRRMINEIYSKIEELEEE